MFFHEKYAVEHQKLNAVVQVLFWVIRFTLESMHVLVCASKNKWCNQILRHLNGLCMWVSGVL